MRTRPAAVAGRFYSDDPAELRSTVESLLASAKSRDAVKAIVAPHAGYVYSGPIAASAYACVPETIERVVLFGPAHRVALRGLGTPTVDAFETPLGNVMIDRDAIERLDALGPVSANDRAHAQEHSLEVQLPFLQVLLDRFVLVPVVVGDATIDEVAAALEAVWGGPETLVVISTDLSHYETYEAARRMDRATADAIVRLDQAAIGDDQACGRIPLRGFLSRAKRLGMRCTELDLRNSGDTAGRRKEVVGYGAFGAS